MNKIAVVYWSGTGHTKAMAESIAAACEAALFTSSEFHAGMVKDYDAIAFGCPSMGNEQLEDFEFEPMFESCKPELSNKKIALFGSYGWGDGEWMRSWESNCTSSGLQLACESVICQDAPDDDALHACAALANALK